MKLKSSSILILVAIFLVVTSLFLFFVGPESIQSRLYEFNPDDRGPAGDAFNGILGPVIAWIAAILTFLAFYIQYQANKLQRQQFQKQADDTAIERFESKFFEMLKLHKENVNEMIIEGYDYNETVEKESSGSFAGNIADFKEKNRTKSETVMKEVKGRKIFVSTYAELKACFEICKHTLTFEKFPGKERYLIKLAYHFLYNGAGSDIVKNIDKTITKDSVYISLCRNNLLIASKQHFSSSGKNNKFKIPDSNISVDLYIKYKPFSGHASRFGHYYRHLFQMVKFVVSQKDSLFPYTAKREYLRILRAQLSDQEQGMLYFNYLSGYGSNWENSANRYFSDYRMIHNMPLHMADFTIKPESEFEEQIALIREGGEEMFEAFE